MIIHFVPIRSNAPLDYEFGSQFVEVRSGDAAEVYHFADLPDGLTDVVDPGTLPLAPIIRAEKSDGELTLYLRLTREQYAPEEVIRPNNPYTVEDAERLLAERDSYVPPPIDQSFGEEGEDD